MSNNGNALAARPSRTVAVRIPEDIHAWLVERQAAFYKENGVPITLSAVVRHILATTRRDSKRKAPR